jgi:hypothetical protein
MEDIEYATCVPLTIDFSSEIARERDEELFYPWVMQEEGEA